MALPCQDIAFFSVFNGTERARASAEQPSYSQNRSSTPLFSVLRVFAPASHPQAWGYGGAMEGVWRGSVGCAPRVAIFDHPSGLFFHTHELFDRHLSQQGTDKPKNGWGRVSAGRVDSGLPPMRDTNFTNYHEWGLESVQIREISVSRTGRQVQRVIAGNPQVTSRRDFAHAGFDQVCVVSLLPSPDRRLPGLLSGGGKGGKRLSCT